MTAKGMARHPHDRSLCLVGHLTPNFTSTLALSKLLLYSSLHVSLGIWVAAMYLMAVHLHCWVENVIPYCYEMLKMLELPLRLKRSYCVRCFPFNFITHHACPSTAFFKRFIALIIVTCWPSLLLTSACILLHMAAASHCELLLSHHRAASLLKCCPSCSIPACRGCLCHHSERCA